MDLDLEELASVLELLKGADFTEFRLQQGDLSLVVTRGVPASAPPLAAVSPAPSPPPATAPERAPDPAPAPASGPAPAPDATELGPGEVTVDAPMLGTFYRSPKPGEQPFVEVGDRLEAGATVGIIEVMKLMSSVATDAGGEVVRVLATDGQLVEAGQPLVVVRTTT